MENYNKAFKVWFSIMITVISLSCLALLSHISYFFGIKNGYEKAVNDMYNGKLRCEKVYFVSAKYVWKDK